jgi:hypothetical protein
LTGAFSEESCGIDVELSKMFENGKAIVLSEMAAFFRRLAQAAPNRIKNALAIHSM